MSPQCNSNSMRNRPTAHAVNLVAMQQQFNEVQQQQCSKLAAYENMIAHAEARDSAQQETLQVVLVESDAHVSKSWRRANRVSSRRSTKLQPCRCESKRSGMSLFKCNRPCANPKLPPMNFSPKRKGPKRHKTKS